MPLTLITAPATEPIRLEEAKDQCQISSSVTDQDAHLTNILIPAARDRGENATGRAFQTQTWDLVLDAFPCDDYVEIPKPPLQSITYVKYRDTAGVLQTWAATNYVVTNAVATPPVLNPRQPRGRLSLAYGISWPSTYGQAGDVTIRFVCGYGDRTQVPVLLKAAMLLDIATLYAQRENVITGTIVAEIPFGAKEIYRSFLSHATQRRT